MSAKTLKFPTKGKLTARTVLANMVKFHVNTVLSRSTLMSRKSDSLDQGNINLDKECKYIEGEPTLEQYRNMYDQEGVATRIVNVFPEECWSIYPEVYETEDKRITKAERRWNDLEEKLDPFHDLSTMDEISGIGSYGGLLYSFNDQRSLDKPVYGLNDKGERIKRAKNRELELIGLRPFSQEMIRVNSIDTDEFSPRFNLPTSYTIRMTDPSALEAGVIGSDFAETDKLMDYTVHWTRMEHIADNCKGNKLYGMPRLRNLHRRVFDIRKILGGSGEMLWKGGFPGISFEADPDLLDVADLDLEGLKDEIQAYSDGLQRYLRLVGMRANSLNPQIADPTNHLTEQYQYICATIGVPMRIFLGSEAGHLASTQDVSSWNRRLSKRQKMYINPRILKPVLGRLTLCNVLPQAKWMISWKDFNTLSEDDLASVSLKKAQAMLQYVTSGSFKLMKPRAFFILILKLSVQEADSIIKELGGEDAILAGLNSQMKMTNGADTTQKSGTSPDKKTGANGQSNALGRGARKQRKTR